MNLPKFNSADGRCYWMKPEVQEELQPLFDQCIQDAIDGKITRLDDSHWPPVVVSSQGAPFEVWQLLRAWTDVYKRQGSPGSFSRCAVSRPAAPSPGRHLPGAEPASPPQRFGLTVDKKLWRKIREKKIAMGHKPDDHEEPTITM